MYNSTIQAQVLGLYFQDYNFLMALSGLLIGFVTLYFMLLTVSKQRFKMDLIIFQVTNDLVFDYFFSIFMNFALVLVPIFASISLVRKGS